MSLRKATEQNGVAGLHLGAIAEVCRKRNCFLFIRPSEPATVRLIKQGFATKSMDIHEKSSDWGLHAGLVPQDPGLSKTPTKTPDENIRPQAHGLANSVPLKLSPAQYASLSGARHFEHAVEIQQGQCAGAIAGYKHFHVETKGQQIAKICLLMKVSDGAVYWRWRPQINPRGQLVPLYVKAYGVTPVTGDYDMWMVAPHYQYLRDEGLAKILTNPDSHGRSASLKYTALLADALNAACRPLYRNGQNVFNHGAEAQNLSFTQEMEKKDLVICCPGRHEPFLMHALSEPERLTQMMHDMLRHGYVVMRNPKWIQGFTLGSEDLAYVPDALLEEAEGGEVAPLQKQVTDSRAAVAKLEGAAASAIQRAFRAHQMEKAGRPQNEIDLHLIRSSTPQHRVWKGRAAKLQEFRKVANIPDDQGRDLVLPADVFPMWNQTALKTDLKSREIGARQEGEFGRSRFVLEGDEGHRGVVPVDESRRGR